MVKVKLLTDTYHTEYGTLSKGASLSVDERTAKRWVNLGIAAEAAKTAAKKGAKTK